MIKYKYTTLHLFTTGGRYLSPSWATKIYPTHVFLNNVLKEWVWKYSCLTSMSSTQCSKTFCIVIKWLLAGNTYGWFLSFQEKKVSQIWMPNTWLGQNSQFFLLEQQDGKRSLRSGLILNNLFSRHSPHSHWQASVRYLFIQGFSVENKIWTRRKMLLSTLS